MYNGIEATIVLYVILKILLKKFGPLCCYSHTSLTVLGEHIFCWNLRCLVLFGKMMSWTNFCQILFSFYNSICVSLSTLFFLGRVYKEMLDNIMNPLMAQEEVNIVKYSVHHPMPSSPNTFIGRAAHIAMLDSELFLEKFILCVAHKYFV